MSTRDPNKVCLSFIRDGDHIRIVDQDGSQVSGVRAASLSVGMDQAAEISLTVLDAPVDPERGNAHTGGGV